MVRTLLSANVPCLDPLPEASAPSPSAAARREAIDVYTARCIDLQHRAQALSLRGRQLQEQLEPLRALRRALELPAEGTAARPSATHEDATTQWLDRFRLPALHHIPSVALMQAVALAQRLFGQDIQLGACACDVQIGLPLERLSARQRQAFGLPPDGALHVTLHFDPLYTQAAQPPTFTLAHTHTRRPMVATSAVPEANHRFRVGFQLTNLLKAALQAAWHSGQAPHTLLSDVAVLLHSRLPTLQQHCVVCDAEQPRGSNALRPRPCERQRCLEKAETLAHGFEPQDIVQAPAAFDMMLTLTYAAAKSGNEKYFQRLPGCYTAGKKSQQLAALVQTMNQLPSVQTLEQSPDMIGTLEDNSPRALPTLAWLTFSNAGYVEWLPPAAQFAAMGTPHQFRIMGGPPQREAAFAARQKNSATTFAFHGAPLRNWHSILRTGLRIGSISTGLGFNGTAEGTGIYVSANALTSASYAKYETAWPQTGLSSQDNALLRCLAICELNGADRKGQKTAQNISVYAREDAVAVRYLFAYPEHAGPPEVHIASLLPQLQRQSLDTL